MANVSLYESAMTAPLDIFLSYGHQDHATARRYAECFEAEGFTVWWDSALRTGEFFDQVIEQTLNQAKAVVVLWSKNSVDSRWVRAEAMMADRNRTLAPVIIEPCQRPIIFALTHTADLSHWAGDRSDPAWRSLISDVRQFVAKGGPQRPAMPSDPHPHSRVSSIPWYRRRSTVVALPVLGIVIAAVMFLVFLRTSLPVAKPAGSNAVGPSAPATPTGMSLAVLPFADMSPRHDQDYFSDGLSEELLNQLGNIKGLRVAGRTSSFSFKNENKDLRVIGEQLGVNHLLEGSVRKAGDQLRITAQLIDSKDGTHIWSKAYDRKLDDVLAVQEDIAKDVAQALSITLDVGSMPRSEGGTTNFEAYDRFLRAVHSRSDIERLNLLHEAVAIDPTFSRAWVQLQDELVGETLVLDPSRAAPVRAELANVRARIEALAPHAWWTQYMNLISCVQDRRWTDCEALARKMLATAPASEYSVLDEYGFFLMSVGRFREAVDYRRRAFEAEPLDGAALFGYLTALDGAGMAGEAMALRERAQKRGGYSQAGDIHLLWQVLADKDATVAAVKARLLATAEDESPLTSLNRTLADQIGNRPKSLATLHTAFDDPLAGQNPFGLFALYKLADYLGDKDLALAALRRSFALKNLSYPWIWQPVSTDLRADPRFKAVLTELGLVSYWRESGNWGDFCRPVGDRDFECR
jgi:TolB-like protein